MFRDQPKVFNQELINQLTQELNDIPVQIQRQEEEKREHIQKIAELQASLIREEKNLQTLEDRLSTLRKDRSAKRNSVTAIKEKMAAITNLTISITKKISSVHEKITSIQTSIPVLNIHLTSLRTKLSSRDYNLPSLNERVSTIEASMSSIRNSLYSTDLELAACQNKLSAANDRSTTIAHEISSLTNKIETINNRVSSLRSSLLSAQSQTNYSRPSIQIGSYYNGQNLGGSVISRHSTQLGVMQGHQLGVMQGHQLGRPRPYETMGSQVQIHSNYNPNNEFEIARIRRELDSAIHDQDQLIPHYRSQISSLSSEKINLQSQIFSFESQIAALTSEKMNLQRQIRSHDDNLSELNNKRDSICSLESEISRLNSELSSKQAQEKRIPEYESDILKLNLELESAKKEQETLAPTHEKELLQLNKQISELNQVVDTLNEEKNHQDGVIEQIKDSSEEHKKQIKALDRQFPQYAKRSEEIKLQLLTVTQFQDKLRNQPQAFYQEISAPLLKNLLAYEKQHYRYLSVAARLCLAQLPNKINFIQDLNLEGQIAGNPTLTLQRSWQIKLALLDGLLWHHLEQLQDEDDEDLAKLIHSALLSLHLAKKGDLPNELALGQDCLSLYHNLQLTHPQALGELKENELVSYERREYQEAMTSLRNTLRKIPQTRKEFKNLVETGEAVAKFYTDKVNELTQNGARDHEHSFELEEFTKILKQTTLLAAKPSNSYYRSEYKKAAEKAEGHPSFGKKLCGILLAFLGAAVVVASVLAAVASFGGSTPLSALGLTVGTSAVAKGLALTGAAAGLATLAGGLGLFNSGKRKSESKIRMQFVNAAGKNNTDPQLVEEEPQQALGDNNSAPPPYSSASSVYPQLYALPPATNPYYTGEEGQEPSLLKCTR